MPLHIVQCGHNRDACFFAAYGYVSYRHWLCEASKFGAVNVMASRENDGYTRVAERNKCKSTSGLNTTSAQMKSGVDVSSYTYVCSNETVYGNEFHTMPLNL